MDRAIFLSQAKGVTALAHVMIAQLALIITPSIETIIEYKDSLGQDQSMKASITIPDLLRQMNYFYINDSNHSSQYRFPLEPAAKIMEMGNPDREGMIQLLFNINLTYPIRSIFELLKSYCKTTGQMSTFTDQPWYRVSAIMRNAFSHDFIIDIRPTKKETREQRIQRLLPKAQWKGIKITRNMLGKVISKKDISIGDHAKLIDAMVAFAHTLI